MLRYNIKTGVNKIKTKTAIAISAVVLGVSGLGMAVAVPALSHAAGRGYNQPPAVQGVCDAGHGAFGAFSDPSLHNTPGQPPYFGDNQLGSARAGATGLNNSTASQYCNQNP